MRYLAAVVCVALALSVSVRAEDGAAPAVEQDLPPNMWHGTVGCYKCDFGNKEGEGECAPALKTSAGVLILKRAPSAPPAIDSFLARIRDGKMKGDYLCNGEMSEADGMKFLNVKTMVAKPLPKAPSEKLTFRSNRRGAAAQRGGGEEGEKKKWSEKSKEEKLKALHKRARKLRKSDKE